MLRFVHKVIQKPHASVTLSTTGRKCKDEEYKPQKRDLLKHFVKVHHQGKTNKRNSIENDGQRAAGVDDLNDIKELRVLPAYKPIELFCDADGNPKDLQAATLNSTAPLNQIEEWIQWTKEGKLWRFPIDNEQDWEGEHSTPFHHHVFFDQPDDHLAKCVPVATFLELVSVGLSQNPYFSVDEKRKHLEWYSEYFKDKVGEINASVQEEIRLNKLEEKARKLSKP